MTERLNFERARDCLSVVVPNGTVLAFLKLVDVKTTAEILLILVTIGYTVWRWRKDASK